MAGSRRQPGVLPCASASLSRTCVGCVRPCGAGQELLIFADQATQVALNYMIFILKKEKG